jgi:hypothetical protein
MGLMRKKTISSARELAALSMTGFRMRVTNEMRH